MEVVIQKGGTIELPEFIMSKFGLKVGSRIDVCIKDKEILIKPVGNVTERIRDSIKLEDPELIERIIESEDWL